MKISGCEVQIVVSNTTYKHSVPCVSRQSCQCVFLVHLVYQRANSVSPKCTLEFEHFEDKYICYNENNQSRPPQRFRCTLRSVMTAEQLLRPQLVAVTGTEGS